MKLKMRTINKGLRTSGSAIKQGLRASRPVIKVVGPIALDVAVNALPVGPVVKAVVKEGIKHSKKHRRH
jgi:hypothetical protein